MDVYCMLLIFLCLKIKLVIVFMLLDVMLCISVIMPALGVCDADSVLGYGWLHR